MEQIAWDAFCYYPRLERVSAYVLEHLDESIAVVDVARVACFERTYFSTYFRTKVGISFTGWLRLMRIVKAVQLLCANDVSISAVARRVGFGSVRTFERCFKMVTGVSPRELKRTIVLRKSVPPSQLLAQTSKILSHFPPFQSL